jgi:hypothetical protein
MTEIILLQMVFLIGMIFYMFNIPAPLSLLLLVLIYIGMAVVAYMLEDK